MSNIFTPEYLAGSFFESIANCKRSIQENGPMAIERSLSAWDETKIHDFANSLLLADFENWLETGESKVSDLYKTFVFDEMRVRLLEDDPFENEIKKFIEAREIAAKGETK